jgi:hypothetical protein
MISCVDVSCTVEIERPRSKILIIHIGREEIALALNATIIRPQLLMGAFDRSAIEIPRYAATLQMVTTPVRLQDFGKGSAAQIDDGCGYPTFAELFVAARLRAAGWTSVWVSPYGRLNFIQDWPWDAPKPVIIQAPQMPERVINRLTGIAELRRQKLGERKVNFNGIPDVIGWRRDDLIMLECKRAKADSLRTNQETWMHCAILCGCSIKQLGIFEWHFGRQINKSEQP